MFLVKSYCCMNPSSGHSDGGFILVIPPQFCFFESSCQPSALVSIRIAFSDLSACEVADRGGWLLRCTAAPSFFSWEDTLYDPKLGPLGRGFILVIPFCSLAISCQSSALVHIRMVFFNVKACETADRSRCLLYHTAAPSSSSWVRFYCMPPNWVHLDEGPSSVFRSFSSKLFANQWLWSLFV